MRKIFLILILLFNGLALADSIDEGVAAYQTKKYQLAITKFKQALDSGYQNASLYYNLGNSFFNLESYGEAIFYYRKALMLEPNDKKVIHNLFLTRTKVNEENITYKSEVLLSPLSVLNKSQIRILFLIALLSCCLFLAIYPLYSYKSFCIFSLIAASYLGALTYGTSYDTYGQPIFSVIKQSSLVVVKDKAKAYSARDKSSQIISVLKEGTELLTDSTQEQWNRALLRNGKKAWLHSETSKIVD